MSAGGTAQDFIVSNGGRASIQGTVTSDVLVASGGVETVLSGGVVSGSSGAGTAISRHGERAVGRLVLVC